MKKLSDILEKKMKGKDPCWDDYKMVGTKKKNGKEVPNCVPEEVDINESLGLMVARMRSDQIKRDWQKLTPDQKLASLKKDREDLKKRMADHEKSMKEGKNHTWKSEGHYTKDGKEWAGPQHAHNGKVMTGEKHTSDSQPLYHFKALSKDVQMKVLAKMQNEETIGKVQRTPGGPKKFMVKVRDKSTGNIKTVRFGDPNMEIKRDDPNRRKSFRARHNCDDPGPRTKARYWSCKQWRAGSKVES